MWFNKQRFYIVKLTSLGGVNAVSDVNGVSKGKHYGHLGVDIAGNPRILFEALYIYICLSPSIMPTVALRICQDNHAVGFLGRRGLPERTGTPPKTDGRQR